MSTRGKVAVRRDYGFIVAAYNHFDSYLEGLGKTLVEKYNSKELAEKIVDKIAVDDDFEISLYETEDCYCEVNENSDLSYIYLWRNNEWMYKRYPFTSEWYSVKDDLGANVNIQDVTLDNESSESSEDSKDVIKRLENDLNVARRDREDLRDAVANGIQNFLKEHPATSLQLLAEKKYKDENESLKKRICELEHEILCMKVQMDILKQCIEISN